MSVGSVKFAIVVFFASFIAIGVAKISHVVGQIIQALVGG